MSDLARRPRATAVPAGVRLSGPPELVHARRDELVRDGHADGLLVEQIPRATQRNGHITIDVVYHPKSAATRHWWQGRSQKFWAWLGGGLVLALAGCGWAVVAIIQAAFAAAAAAAPAVVGALLVLGIVVVLASVKGGGGTWTGSGRWSS